MKKEWLDRPVLCLLDTRQIQAFMFRANSYEDILGGSDLMVHILDDAIAASLKSIDPPLANDEFDLSVDPEGEIPFFTSERVKFQLIMVKEEYAARDDLPDRLRVMNRYAYTENDTLTLRDYRISCGG